MVLDSNPGELNIALNGADFQSGTAVSSPGPYLLVVEAEDLAGNSARRTVAFTILPPTGGLALVVNSSNDGDDGVCDERHCSLREALRAANLAPGSTISFAIPALPAVIRPRTALPEILHPVVIDGVTQEGASCNPRDLAIELRGDAVVPAASGLVVRSSGVVIRGLAIAGFDGYGIELYGAGNEVSCNRIGPTLDGEPLGNALGGVRVGDGAGDSRVGFALGATPVATGCEAACNRIAFNGGSGIAVAAGAGSGNLVLGNRIDRNAGLAIDLGEDELTANDPGDVDVGPNGLQNFPVVEWVRPGGTSTVRISLESEALADYRLDLYAVEVPNADPDGLPTLPDAGELAEWLASTVVTTAADGSAATEVAVGRDLTGLFVAATATGLTTANTSEASLASNLAAVPSLAATKTDALADDADGDTVVSPGDTLLYEVTVVNTGSGPAGEVVMDDPLPATVSLVPGSVTVTQGVVVSTDPLVVDLGTIEAGADATVSFEVQITDPVPAGLAQLINQAVISSAELDPLPTDDPDALGPFDPTTTTVVAAPDLTTAALAVDDDTGNADGQAQPGEPLTYTVLLANSGDEDDTAVRTEVVLPATLVLDLSSVQIDLAGGASGAVDTSSGSRVEVSTAHVPGRGGSVRVEFIATVVDSAPAGLESLEVRAGVESAAVPFFETAAATISLDALPDLVLDKDDGGAIATVGESFEYLLDLENVGDQDASGVVLADVVPDGTFFDAPTSDARWSCADGDPAGTDCRLDLGELAAGGSEGVDFGVRVLAPPDAPAVIVNVAGAADDGLGSGGVPVEASDSVSTPVDDLEAPRVALIDTVPGSGDGVLEPCEMVQTGVTGLAVRFSEAMDPSTVLATSNWAVFAAGEDQDLSSFDCDGPLGDDVEIELSGIDYDPASGEAELSWVGALEDAPHRVVACSGGLADLSGDPLDGDGDGSGGDDFALTFRVDRSNLFENGELDCDLSAWVLVAPGGSTIEYASIDVDGASVSGSAHFVAPAGTPQLSAGQCVESLGGSMTGVHSRRATRERRLLRRAAEGVRVLRGSGLYRSGSARPGVLRSSCRSRGSGRPSRTPCSCPRARDPRSARLRSDRLAARRSTPTSMDSSWRWSSGPSSSRTVSRAETPRRGRLRFLERQPRDSGAQLLSCSSRRARRCGTTNLSRTRPVSNVSRSA